MYSTVYISLYAFCSVLCIFTIVETRCIQTDRRTDRQTLSYQELLSQLKPKLFVGHRKLRWIVLLTNKPSTTDGVSTKDWIEWRIIILHGKGKDNLTFCRNFKSTTTGPNYVEKIKKSWTLIRVKYCNNTGRTSNMHGCMHIQTYLQIHM